MIKFNNIKNKAALSKAKMAKTCKLWLSAIRAYHPMEGDKEILDAQYSSGVWHYLKGLNELSRFSVVVGYCHYLKNNGAILEIGCGEGVLQERLFRSRYSYYVGIDISDEAIRRTVHKQDANNSFVREDARTYKPTKRFDVIIFNECLEYFENPLNLLKRYEDFLEEDGIYIVSMFVGTDTIRTKRIWKMLESAYKAEAETRLRTKPGYSWIIRVFIPAAYNR